MKPARMLALFAAVALLSTGCRKAAPTGVAAQVNTRPITYDEVDKQYKLQFPTPSPETSEDQVVIQKLEVLRGMIDNEILLQRAEKRSLMALDSEVEAKVTELKSPYTQEEFQRQLNEKKLSLDELKAQLRRDLSIQKLLNKDITSHISISDKDVTDYYTANKAMFNLAEPQVHLAQILVTPQPDPNVHNLKNDKAQNEDQAKQKIGMVMARLKQGEDFAMVAQSLSEDPNTAPNGGDLGFVAESSLEQANVELRKMVMSLQPGQISPIIHTGEGYRILKLVAKEPAGQRELNDPRVQQNIRETLLNRKDQLMKAAYYEIARNEAAVSNFYAQTTYEKFAGTGK